MGDIWNETRVLKMVGFRVTSYGRHSISDYRQVYCLFNIISGG